MTENESARRVTIDGLSHSYDDVAVLHDIHLDVAPGESLALLGPSGCGKTTLLRIIAGLERPQTGSVTIGGQCVYGPDSWVGPEHRSVGLVFQDWALFPHLSVEANVGYGLARKDRKGSHVRDALAMVGLEQMGERMPSTLSGGQQQRAALARAIAARPSVLLLDEPFSNLDATLRADVRTEVKQLLIELGVTAVFVTHDQAEAFVLGDRVAVMRDGRIAQIDTPTMVYSQPSDVWTAEFVGTASVVSAEAHGSMAMLPFGEVPLASPMDGTCDVLFRPEQLAITEGSDATVESVEFYGAYTTVVVTVANTQLRVTTPPSTTISRGTQVGLTFIGDTAAAYSRD